MSRVPQIESAQQAVSVTPNDADLIRPTRGVYVGATGTLKVTMSDGSDVTFNSIAAGVVHPLSVKRVFATGTTATGIVAVY